MIELTTHAKHRMAQRRIPEQAIALVAAFGSARQAKGGALRIRLNAPAVRRAIAAGTPSDEIAMATRVVAVISSDARVITAWREEFRPTPSQKTREHRQTRRAYRARCRIATRVVTNLEAAVTTLEEMEL